MANTCSSLRPAAGFQRLVSGWQLIGCRAASWPLSIHLGLVKQLWAAGQAVRAAGQEVLQGNHWGIVYAGHAVMSARCLASTCSTIMTPMNNI
jgi:hypothetical protein